MDDDEDVPTCPLCLEELDATDRAVKACQCGYQVCLWCLHLIRERHNGKCPACRTPYIETNFKIAEVNHELAAKEAKERATAKKERERREKLKEIERERARAMLVSQQKAKTNLKHVRMVQRNLVYIIGLSLSLAREEILRRPDMFAKFGRITKVLVNRAHPYNADMPGGPSISAYVQYVRDADATAAMRSMNNTVYDGREIRCAIACTKYCDAFVLSGISEVGIIQHCGNSECMYYHELCQSEDVLSRDEVLARQLGPPPPAHLFASHCVGRASSQPARPNVSGPARSRSLSSAPNGGTGRGSGGASSAQSSRRTNQSHNRRSPPASPEARLRILQNPRTPVRASSVQSNPQLPSSAGWGSSLRVRSVSRSPPKASSSLNDGRRKPPPTTPNSLHPSTASSPVRKFVSKKRSPPPGFESVPSKSEPISIPPRQPGMDHIGTSTLQTQTTELTTQQNPAQHLGAPPGFTMPSFAPTSLPEKQSPSSLHPSMAWSKKASEDQIVASGDRVRSRARLQSAVGAPVTPIVEPRSNPEFADVLARLGGNLGVTSEVNLNPVITPFASMSLAQQRVISSPGLRSADRSKNSAFVNRPAIKSDAQAPPPGMMNVAQNQGTCVGAPSGYLGPGVIGGHAVSRRANAADMKLSKRNNSRFGFARDESQLSLPTPSVSQLIPDLGVHLLHGDPVFPTERTVPPPNTYRSGRAPQQSRFNFVEPQAPVPKPHFPVPTSFQPPVYGEAQNRQRPHAPSLSPSNPESAISTFSRLSTADKLASLFNHAHWAPEALPPMPVLSSGGVSLGHTPNTERTGKVATDELQLLASLAPSRMTREIDVQTEAAHAAENLSTPPPGFREATSGKPPETQMDEATSLSTAAGVAGTAETGGYDDYSSVNGEESMSSGVESVEEVDRKRSRSQRKRDKKARQKREAAERRIALAASEAAARAAANSLGNFSTQSQPTVSVQDSAVNAGAQSNENPPVERNAESGDMVVSLNEGQVPVSTQGSADSSEQLMTVSELEREVKAARKREAQLQSRLMELQRRIRSYDNIR